MVNCVTNTYEGIGYIMTRQRKNTKNEARVTNKNSQTVEKEALPENFNNGINITISKKTLILITVFIILSIASSIILVGKYWGGRLLDFSSDFKVLQSDFKVLQNNVQESSKDLEKINERTISINNSVISLQKENESFKSELNSFKNSQNAQIAYLPTGTIIKTLSTVSYNKADNNFLSQPTWNENDVIARNPHTGRQYKAKNLKNKKILLPYTEDGKDIYFFGQFNKYNHWDGNCILNVYKNDKLYMIMEGNYNDGELISYEQVMHYKNKSGVKVWSVSERKVKDHTNAGETYTYFKTKNKKCNFMKNDVESSDIMSVLDFKNWLNTPVEGYYYGNTSGGKYNDNTGNAYLIKFFKSDKTVRTLYIGNFKNGIFEDHTVNAWYIAREEDDKNYIYFKGSFTNGSPDETVEHKRENIKNNEIHNIIDKFKFKEEIILRKDVYSNS